MDLKQNESGKSNIPCDEWAQMSYEDRSHYLNIAYIMIQPGFTPIQHLRLIQLLGHAYDLAVIKDKTITSKDVVYKSYKACKTECNYLLDSRVNMVFSAWLDTIAWYINSFNSYSTPNVDRWGVEKNKTKESIKTELTYLFNLWLPF